MDNTIQPLWYYRWVSGRSLMPGAVIENGKTLWGPADPFPFPRCRPSEPHVVSMDPPTPENDPVGRFRSPAAEFLAQQRREGATHEPPKRWECTHCHSVNVLSNWKCYFCGRLR
jgi:hypothetical protein